MAYSLYCHIPFCVSKCLYCDFFSLPCCNVSEDYLNCLLKEIDFYKNKFSIDHFRTVYVGGGTPSLLSAHQIELLLSSAVSSQTIEVTMEMNPESLTEEKLRSFSNSGGNRLSLGIQSFNDKALETIGRVCRSKHAEKALDTVKKVWNGRLNLDVIAGLPDQSDDEFLLSLEKVLSYNPDHVSMYTLTVEEETPLYSEIEANRIKFDFDDADRQWLLGREILFKKGFTQYEVSNFSLPGAECLHNLTYWNLENYIGVGAGASGSVYGSCGERWANKNDVDAYVKNISALKFDSVSEREELPVETQEFEFLMMGLRKGSGVNSAEYSNRFSSVAPWNGNLDSRLNFLAERISRKEKPDGSADYFLDKNQILFLNKILLDL